MKIKRLKHISKDDKPTYALWVFFFVITCLTFYETVSELILIGFLGYFMIIVGIIFIPMILTFALLMSLFLLKVLCTELKNAFNRKEYYLIFAVLIPVAMLLIALFPIYEILGQFIWAAFK